MHYIYRLKYFLIALFITSMLSIPTHIKGNQSDVQAKTIHIIWPLYGATYVLENLLTHPSHIGAPIGKFRELYMPGNRIAKHIQTPVKPYSQIIHTAASRHQVDPALIKAVILAESKYNPEAVSKKGAKGLMQLMPATARSLGVMDIFDPEDNINGGTRYLKKLLDRFDGNIKLALAAYNAGSRYVKKYGGVPPFLQTRTFIKNVLKYHREYREVDV